MKYTPEELALLDMFAGQALVGILTGDASYYVKNPDVAGSSAYLVAEAMLEARKKFIE